MILDYEIDSYIPVLKYFIFSLNFIIWLMGGLLLMAGISIRIDGYLWEYTEALSITRYTWACYFSIFIGCTLLIIGFLGCLGAVTESPFLLLVYCFVTGICIIFEILICGFVWKVAGGDELQAILSKDIEWHIEKMNKYSDSRRFLDLIQLKLECCGAYSHKDYEYKNKVKPVTCNSERTNNIQIRSCGENLRRYLERRGGFLGGICVGIILAQLFCLLLKFLLMWVLKEIRRESPQYKKTYVDNLMKN